MEKRFHPVGPEKKMVMENTLKVGICQVEGSPSLQENLEKAHKYFYMAADKGIDLLVFPEMFMAVPGNGIFPSDVAPHENSFLSHMTAMSRNFHISCIVGSWEPSDDRKRPYNTACVISQNGDIIARYRKIHLFDALKITESRITSPGPTPPPVVKIKNMNVGIAICYDLRFAEIFRHLTTNGADVIVVISAWYGGIGKEDHWLTMLRARAIEYTCYIVGCNMVGSKFCGRSAVFDPFGISLGDAGEIETLLDTTLKKDRIISVRERLPVLKHRRMDILP